MLEHTDSMLQQMNDWIEHDLHVSRVRNPLDLEVIQTILSLDDLSDLCSALTKDEEYL